MVKETWHIMIKESCIMQVETVPIKPCTICWYSPHFLFFLVPTLQQASHNRYVVHITQKKPVKNKNNSTKFSCSRLLPETLK